MMSKLGVFDVSVRYGKVPALTDVTLHLEAGERVFISGPNGAGKSSLLGGLSPTTVILWSARFKASRISYAAVMPPMPAPTITMCAMFFLLLLCLVMSCAQPDP